jgi:hypothetical protein
MPRKYMKKQLEKKSCEQCGASFTSLMPHARFCSGRCQRLTHYLKATYDHKCVECGSYFASRQHKARVCSPACQLSRATRKGHEGAKINSFPRIHPSRAFAYKLYSDQRAALLAQQPSEKFTHQEIFERDDWVCRICGEAVDRSLKFPDPRSVCIDHIRPIIANGNNLRSNVQCAHFGCNSKKGASFALAG